MSTATVQAPVQEAKTLSVVEKRAPVLSEEVHLADDHPFVLLGIFIAIAMTGAVLFVGTIILCLALRDSGVLGFTI